MVTWHLRNHMEPKHWVAMVPGDPRIHAVVWWDGWYKLITRQGARAVVDLLGNEAHCLEKWQVPPF